MLQIMKYITGLRQLPDLMKIYWPLSKNARLGGMAMSANQTAMSQPYSKAQCQESQEEGGNPRGGETTAENEESYLSLPKRECSDQLL